ncbi:MAG: GAF domain-containing sensor histidine kinase [Firmicutes bacterium]|nr:GAF domain-containing sensor histidine kinase [Bacillota bacterium]
MEKIYVLSESKESYNKFFNLINNHYNNSSFNSDCDELMKNIENQTSNHPSYENLNILFIEYPYMDKIEDCIKNIDSSNYIVISFYTKKPSNIHEYKNLFEFINVSAKTNIYEFFFNKLKQEIINKKKILFLQSEVKEFYEIGKSLSSERDTMKLLNMIINSSMKLTNSDGGTIYLVIDKFTKAWSSIKNSNYEDKLLKFEIAKNNSMNINLETSTTPITKESIFGHTVITGNSLKIDDVYNIDKNLSYKHNKKFDMLTGYKTKSMLSIPMKDNENNVTGVIQLINKKTSYNEKIDYSSISSLKKIISYDDNDESIMNSLASQAAVILDNNILYKDMQNLLNRYKEQNEHLSFLSKKLLKSNEDERKRIAREIHDGPAQYSSNSLLRLELIKKYFEKENYDKYKIELNNLEESLRETLKETRTIIYDLKPSYLENGLISSIKTYLNKFIDRTNLDVQFDVTGDDSSIEYYMTSALFRITQEALSNIDKHADAKSVNINFKISNRKIILKVLDDGKGFDISKFNNKKPSLKGGFGLEGIKERVDILKGSISIDSEINKGTEIKINIPL